MSGRKYFGTDGIRGLVGDGEMQADFVLRLGRAAGRVLCPDGGTVVIGKDTRISGYLFESALEAGLASAGADIALLGPMPTPAIAYMVQAEKAAAGVVISASHNPYHDNGLKFFSAAGAKLDDATEAAIEAEIDAPFSTVAADRIGKAHRVDNAVEQYVSFCASVLDAGISLTGLRIVLDCAHGATYRVAPEVFTRLGAQVSTIGCKPDGLNINLDCGSTHPQALQKAVVDQQAQLGIAFDGDGDRVVMVAPDGHLLDGDDLLYVLARDYAQRGALGGPVVGTVMSNLGLERALGAHDIPFKRAKVGDRHVLAALQETGGVLGGESSGHVLCLDKATTGDGIIAALLVLQSAVRAQRGVHEIAAEVIKLPQKMINVRTEGRADVSHPEIMSAVADTEARLEGRGRVLLRPSGTEPVVRVMVEGEDIGEVGQACEALAEVVGRVCASVGARV